MLRSYASGVDQLAAVRGFGSAPTRAVGILTFLSYSHIGADEDSEMALSPREIKELEAAARAVERSRPAAARLIRRIARESSPDQKGYYTTTQAAAVLRATAQTVRNWVDLGWLPSTRPHPRSRRRLIPAEALQGVVDFDRKVAARRGQMSDEEAAALVHEYRRSRQSAPSGSR